MKRAVLLLLTFGCLSAQTRLPVQCSDEDITSLDLPCSEEDPCPVYVELSSLEVVGSKLFAVGNLHTDAATLYSLLLLSTDGGKTWTEPFARIRAGSLDQVQFIDFERGWISGQVTQGLPRDPFLLLTTDGGATWRRRPVWDEMRVGLIEQFWFESRNNGVMFIDRVQRGESGTRYERYESQTGGESWSIREASAKPIPVKRPAIAGGNPDWRLRPDGKAYRIEKRAGGKWAVVSTFPIRTGECKPPARPEPEGATPPPEEPPASEAPLPPSRGPKKAPSLKKTRP